MVQLQVLNKILNDKDFSFIDENNLTEEYFSEYKNEFKFIKEHVQKYDLVPDKPTFIAKFPKFKVIDVQESDKYLIDKIREEYLYNISVPMLQKAADLYGEDANMAVDYILSNFKNIQPNYGQIGIDIINQAEKRYEELLDKREHKDHWFFKSGFDELDAITNGLQRGEELVILFARVNQGKSWIAEKMAVSVWEQGYNVGFFSPEMSAESIGYRFDTLHKNFSNHLLITGEKSDYDNDYQKYIKELPNKKNKFLVSTPLDFNRKTTISKLRNWVKNNDLDMIVIDGLSYLIDERYRRGDNTTTTLTNISEDLMSLSVELKIPIIAVVQANRDAVGDKDTQGTPELETIRNSDGISHNASLVISLQQKMGTLEMAIKKNRNGSVGNKFIYSWDINNGTFSYIPSGNSGLDECIEEEMVKENKDKYKDITDIF